VAKLVVTYFSRQSNQNEVLNIMSSILEFTEDEKIQVRVAQRHRGIEALRSRARQRRRAAHVVDGGDGDGDA
jgi:transcription elongation factor GreA-like protein